MSLRAQVHRDMEEAKRVKLYLDNQARFRVERAARTAEIRARYEKHVATRKDRKRGRR